MRPANKAECVYWVVVTYIMLVCAVAFDKLNWYFWLVLVCNIYWTLRYLMEKRHWLGA